MTALSEEEREHNERLYEETMAVLFPEDSMKDRFYRDKDKENAARVWILSVIVMQYTFLDVSKYLTFFR